MPNKTWIEENNGPVNSERDPMTRKHFEEHAGPIPGAGIKKILLVDDSSTSRMTSRMLLAGHESYVLTSACDGKEGLEKALAELPNLILMDIEMPRMNGIEACKVLKQNEATKNIPIVLLTMRGRRVVRPSRLCQRLQRFSDQACQ
jgi:CheY-like chemotaxis protein